MARKKIDAKSLVQKIEKITRERMLDNPIIQLSDFRELSRKQKQNTILVIEDDEVMRTALRRILETDGHKVIAAADGTQLSEVLDDTLIDLIILDIGLPWINGFELAHLMKEHDDLKSLPLIFISGKCSEKDVRKAFEIGADDYIKKPFEVEKVKSAVNTLLSLHYSR